MYDEPRYYISGSDVSICHRHIDEKGIAEFIKSNITAVKCSYCNARRSVSLDIVMSHIMDCITEFYEDPIEGNGAWDSEERAWAVEYPDTEELLIWNLIPKIDPYQLQEEITSRLSDDLWIDKNPYHSEDDLLFYDWEFFSDLVKHHMRFVFYKSKVKRIIDMREFLITPYSILDDIGKTINFLSLFKTLTPKKRDFLLRARQHSNGELISKGVHLGSPPRMKAKSNRFSPAGIPMFYGASNKETAILETLCVDPASPLITVGKFLVKKPLTLIDLTNLPEISLFDKGRNRYLMALSFLKRFIDDISRPISYDGSEHIDYVPTQVITEYFRFVMPEEYHIKIDGVYYCSVKNPNHFCYVLFLDEDQSTQDDTDHNNKASISLELASLTTVKL